MAQKGFLADNLLVGGDSVFKGDITVKGDLILSSNIQLTMDEPAQQSGGYVQFFDDIDVDSNRIINVAYPVLPTDGASASYVYSEVGTFMADAPTEHLEILNNIESTIVNSIPNGIALALVEKADVLYVENKLSNIQSRLITSSSQLASQAVTAKSAVITSALNRLEWIDTEVQGYNSRLSVVENLLALREDSIAADELYWSTLSRYYAESRINALIGWAPDELNSLAELSQAIVSNKNYLTGMLDNELAKKIDRTTFDSILDTKAALAPAMMWTSTNTITYPGSYFNVKTFTATQFVGDGSQLTGLVSPEQLNSINAQVAELLEMLDFLEEKVSLLTS